MTEVNAFLRFPDNVSFDTISNLLNKVGASLDIVVGEELSYELSEKEIRDLDESIIEADNNEVISTAELLKEIESRYAD